MIFLPLENSFIFSTKSLSGLLVSLEILWQRLPNWKRNKRKPTFIFEKCSLFPKVLDPPSSACFVFVPLTIILIAWFASKVCIFGSHLGFWLIHVVVVRSSNTYLCCRCPFQGKLLKNNITNSLFFRFFFSRSGDHCHLHHQHHHPSSSSSSSLIIIIHRRHHHRQGRRKG